MALTVGELRFLRGGRVLISLLFDFLQVNPLRVDVRHKERNHAKVSLDCWDLNSDLWRKEKIERGRTKVFPELERKKKWWQFAVVSLLTTRLHTWGQGSFQWTPDPHVYHWIQQAAHNANAK